MTKGLMRLMKSMLSSATTYTWLYVSQVVVDAILSRLHREPLANLVLYTKQLIRTTPRRVEDDAPRSVLLWMPLSSCLPRVPPVFQSWWN